MKHELKIKSQDSLRRLSRGWGGTKSVDDYNLKTANFCYHNWLNQ